jgi:hypothetical protein
VVPVLVWVSGCENGDTREQAQTQGVGNRYDFARTARRRVESLMTKRHHLLLACLRGNSAALHSAHAIP